MRKYVLTDRQGVTATGQTLAPGKFIQARRDKSNLMQGVNECGADTPLLAALISPIPSDQARLFSIHCWNVTIDPNNAQSYTVVKEMENVPAVSTEQRLRFAVLLAVETCHDKDFRHWADRWLSGLDTTAHTARVALAALDKELEAAAAITEIGADNEERRFLEEGAQRARHVLRAVERFEAPERATSAAMEIAQALTGLGRLPASVPLAAMCTLATGNGPWRQAAG